GWERRAAHLLDDDVRRAHRRLTADVVGAAGANGDVATVVNELIGPDGRELESYRAICAQLKQEEEPTLAGLISALRELERLGRARVGGARSAAARSAVEPPPGPSTGEAAGAAGDLHAGPGPLHSGTRPDARC